MASAKLKIVEHSSTEVQSLVGDYLAHQRGRGLSPPSARLTIRFAPGWCRDSQVVQSR